MLPGGLWAPARPLADHRYDFTTMARVIVVSEEQEHRTVAKVRNVLGAQCGLPLDNARVGAVWLSSKADTNDRASGAITMGRIIAGLGAGRQAFDPTVPPIIAGRRPETYAGIAIRTSRLDAAAGTQGIVVVTERADFAKTDPSELAAAMAPKGVVDSRSLLDGRTAPAAGSCYDAGGRQ